MNTFAYIIFSLQLFDYFADSNMAGKVIVILLGIFSLIAWTVMLGKYADLKELESLNASAENKLSRGGTVIETVANAKGMKGPYASLMNEAVAAWGRTGNSNNSPEMLNLKMNHVQNALQRCVVRQCALYESKMVLLGTIISGAPFFGLLGTVWGVMDSFGSIGTQPSVTLQALAPGVSGALLTTVAGLVVALPSLFGYNYLLATSNGMVNKLENFASSLADKMELESKIKTLAGTEAQSFKKGESVISEPHRERRIRFDSNEDEDGVTPSRNYE